jgi:RHS repeat-associated protein
MRTGTASAGTVNYLLGDHLGSTAITLDSAGGRLNTNTELRYYPYGVVRYTAGATLTSFNFTGQRKDSGSGLLFYNARWYDPQIGRFLQADTIVPAPGDPQSLNRYAYVRNNPLRRVDPTGHADIPSVPELMEQAIKFFAENGWRVVGDPSKINPNWNGADLVFTREGGRVLAVELKDIAGKVDLGTLGKSARFLDYGGSIDRVGRSAVRFAESSVEQLRLMSQTVRDAKNAGTLENALFISAEGVTQKAQEQFGAVYRMTKDGVVITEKAAAAGSALTVAKGAIVSAATMLGSQPFMLPAPIILPQSMFEQFTQQYYGMYGVIPN